MKKIKKKTVEVDSETGEVVDAPITEQKSEAVPTDRVRKAVDYVTEKFNLNENFILTKYEEKGTVVKITLLNGDYEISFTIFDAIKEGIVQ